MKPIIHIVGDEDGLRNVQKDRRTRNNKPDPVFGKEIKLRRKVLGLTQVELAEACDVHQVTLCRYEKGTVPMPDDRRKAIEEVLHQLESE